MNEWGYVIAGWGITAVVLVDTSASMAPNLDSARAAAEQFVIRMFPGDTARVGSFSDSINVSPTFTSDRDELIRGDVPDFL